MPSVEREVTRFQEFLQKQGLKLTSERTALIREIFSIHYHFEADQVMVIRDRIIVARPARLYFGDVPVMVLPFVVLVLPAGEVAATLRAGAGELCESVRLFDVYTGEQIGEGKKSLAYAMRFRAPDRTLTDAEVAEAREAAVALAVERHGAVHRS